MERRKRVLVVDDERVNRELLEAILTGFGHDVDMASDGAEALAKLDSSHDLILLDVMMPGIDGFEVVRRIRHQSQFPNVPVCMVTALSGREERLRAVEGGANDFISKPIDKTELRVRTTALLATKEAQDTVQRYYEKLTAQNLALQESFDELEKAGNLRDEFIAIASHDLKNPLMCVSGFASLIQQTIKPGSLMTEQAHLDLGRIIHHSARMGNIIKNFLDFRAAEEGEVQVVPASVDLNVLAEECREQNAAYAEGKQIALAMELAENTPVVHADPSHVSQVLDNLVGNAIKFSGRRGEVIIRTRPADRHVTLEVSDNGPGLDDEDLGKLFVKYARLSNKPTGGESSSGLGLSICKRMIELNGGEIGAQNNEGGGTTFWFRLPVRTALDS